MQKIIPCLWFADQAEEAVNFYASVFSAQGGSALGGKKTKIKDIAHYDEASSKVAGRPKGSVLTVQFELYGQEFIALNGGPLFKFTEAISFVVNCETQEEVDELWDKLTAGGEPGQCGWLKDRYGVSWQIVPTVLDKLLSDPDPVKSQRVMEAMLQMNKLDIAALKKSYEQ